MINKLMKIYRVYAVREYFWIRKTTASRKGRQIKFLLLTPILLIICAWNYFYEHTINRIILQSRYKNDLKKKYKYDLIFAGIAKNEGSYIKEWIEYHKLVGVEKFIIYDNGSTDNMKEVLQPYIESGQVEYVYFPGRAKQLDAYYDALKRYKNQTKLMGFIDLDEFVLPVAEDKTIAQTIQEIIEENQNAAGVAINWCIYGSSGHQKRPEGLVMENYLRRADYSDENNRCIKTIVNPRMIKGYIFDPHAPMYYCGYRSVNEVGRTVEGPWNPHPNNSYERIRINHYYCKSVEEGKIKFDRGLATHEQDIKNEWEKYSKFDKNDVFDDIILRYRDAVKQAVQ